MKKTKKILIGISASIAALLAISVIAFLVYAGIYYKADSSAIDALSGNTLVTVTETDDYWVFEPVAQVTPGVDVSYGNNTLSQGNTNSDNITTGSIASGKIGYIFYPGGKVEEKAYAPLMLGLAQEGVTCILLKLPLRLAVLSPNAASKAIDDFPSIKTWYTGGHSLGGAMSTSYAAANSDRLKGVILMGAYPTKDLSSSNLRILSFYGSEDMVLNRKNFENNKKYQTNDSTYIEIKGGNHAFYGNYGEQKGDGNATISQKEQQTQVIKKIVSWLEQSEN